MISARGFLAVAVLLMGIGRLSAANALFDVRGTGWWEDRLIERSLRDLREGNADPWADANAVEDAIFFTMSSVADKGFLDPQVQVVITPENGAPMTHDFDRAFTTLLPRPLRATAVRLEVERGIRYQFGDVNIAGVESVIPVKRARDLLVPPSGLIPSAEAQAFTPSRLQAGLGRIELVLREKGYPEAVARAVKESRDPVTGLVDVAIEVDPGARWWVRSGEIVAPPDLPLDRTVDQLETNVPWSLTWAQDQVEKWRRKILPLGYPDVSVTVEPFPGPVESGERAVAVVVRIEPGPVVTLGEVKFVGEGDMNPRTLARRVDATPGEVVNRLALEQSRRRLSRLSAFRRVMLSYTPSTGTVRSPVFEFERRLPWESYLLLGWGSYEKLRGGVEVRGNNLWNRSHQVKWEGMASTRSLRTDLVYTVPDVLGEMIDGSLRGFGLDRDEFAFQRQEYGVTATLSRRDLPWVKADGAVSYTFQNLTSGESVLASRVVDATESRSASVTFTLNRDRRDNPLLPTEGYRWFTQLEVADQVLGGEVGYQRLEWGVSWHHPLGDTHWIHLGASQGLVWTLGQDDDSSLPVNKRFFPGGEQSYRGLQSGEGSPVGPNGEYLGAKSTTLLNLEFAQALTSRINLVVFADILMATAELSQSPWDDTLYAVGAGLRYNTIIGPVRLEYGHNLNPREVDPSGTLHLSIGFPF